MTSVPFASWSRNGEDVVLNRTFADLPAPRVLELSAGARRDDSPTRALAEHGWRVEGYEHVRPAQLSGLIEDLDGSGELQLLVVGERDLAHPAIAALQARDLAPWVVLSPAIEHWDAAGYQHALYDGVNDFLLADGHPELRTALGYPAGSRDEFSTPTQRSLETEIAHLGAELARWRASALQGWEERAAHSQTGSAHQELAAMRSTLSWRVTRPLRVLRRRVPSGLRG